MISVAVLAGGRSQRMGRDKAFLEIGGQPVIQRIINRVNALTDNLLISTNTPEKYERFGLPLVPDVYPHQGPLGGVYSVIRAAVYPHVLILACDLPFLNVDLLRYLIKLAPTADVVIPLVDSHRPEMLHAVYSKNCLPAIRNCLQNNRFRLTELLQNVAVHYVQPAQVAQFDADFHSFFNLNTPEDWQKAQETAKTVI